MPSAFGGQSQQRWGDGTLNVSEYMRDFFATDLNGKTVGTADARRKGMTVIAFFEPGNADSEQLMPYLQKFADGYKESGKLSVLALSGGDLQATQAFVQKYALKFPVVIDYDRYHAMVYGVTTNPTLVFADKDGLVRRKITGFRGRALNEISAAIAQTAEAAPVTIVDNEPMPALPPPPAPVPDAAPAGSAPAIPATAAKPA